MGRCGIAARADGAIKMPGELEMPTIQLKRIYEPMDAEDSLRVLVDRLWARGVSKAGGHLDAWMKDLGPSDELRQWFGHRAELWSGFQARYRRELSAPLRQLFLDLLQSAAGKSTITLVYGARDSHQNEAVVLRAYLLDHPAAHDRKGDATLFLLAAVAAVAAAQPSGEAPGASLRPFVDAFLSGQQLEEALQALRDHGEVQKGQNGWQLAARGHRLLRDVSSVSAE
jgi:uncharacterized protein YeaO (DUF488 family)